MSFDFVPRSVKKRKTGPSASTPILVVQSLTPKSDKTSEATATETTSSKEYAPLASTSKQPVSKPTAASSKEPDLKVLADLVCLALSDYALWADVDLRRKIDWSANTQHPEEESEEETIGNDVLNDAAGYIPLAYLLRHSSVFAQASSSPSFGQHPETTYVKALRIHATESLDVRLVLSSEDTPFGRSATEKWSNSSRNQTGYEVRRKHPAIVDGSNLSEHGKADWDRLTIYVENIPINYRNMSSTLKFIAGLLSSAPSPPSPRARIQSVAFPRHHRDQPTSIPVCKGFALVTLTFSQDVSYVLEKWPWDAGPTNRDSKIEDTDKHLQVLQDAARFGFRSVSKERWDALKAEYLVFRQQLVEEINDFQEKEQASRRRVEAAQAPSKPGPSSTISSSQGLREQHGARGDDSHVPVHVVSPGPSKIHANSSYPSGCLVFVRHIHSETNKTTLRTLFAQAWSTDAGASSNGKPVDGIDYLDYMKGMDSCHIRLSTPSHAQRFVDFFSAHPTQQTSGLDNVGSPSQSPDISITAELVLGKREEVYWEKVPEKVRRQAVGKALKLMGLGGDHAGVQPATEDGQSSRNIGNGSGHGKRKR